MHCSNCVGPSQLGPAFAHQLVGLRWGCRTGGSSVVRELFEQRARGSRAFYRGDDTGSSRRARFRSEQGVGQQPGQGLARCDALTLGDARDAGDAEEPPHLLAPTCLEEAPKRRPEAAPRLHRSRAEPPTPVKRLRRREESSVARLGAKQIRRRFEAEPPRSRGRGPRDLGDRPRPERRARRRSRPRGSRDTKRHRARGPLGPQRTSSSTVGTRRPRTRGRGLGEAEGAAAPYEK